MILADENIDYPLIEAILGVGIEVYSIFELNRGMMDEAIIEFSRVPPRIILTEDKDFGEWVYAHNLKEISVLFLRYDFKDTELMKQALLKILADRIDELHGHFTTLSIHKVRIRKI